MKSATVQRTMMAPVTDSSFCVPPLLNEIADDDEQDDVERLQAGQLTLADGTRDDVDEGEDHDDAENELHRELGDVLYAENVLVKALPKLAEEATDEQLRAGFEAHLKETKRHVKNVEQAFSTLGETAKAE